MRTIDWRMDACASDAGIYRTQVVIIATGPAAPAIPDIASKVWSNNIAMSLVGPNGVLVNFHIYEGIGFRAGPMADARLCGLGAGRVHAGKR